MQNVWPPLGAPEPRKVRATLRVVINASQSQKVQFMEASEQMALHDARMSWSTCHHYLAGYHKVLHKVVLPHK